ncbi:LytR/AlgR family response regulator transcription factor [Polaribacter sp. R77954]|uniref:LytR/AlgR family response regulator transcription factor n=1 Tax=Polaribacter sp. R77954 TaxID=3093870 RepID=UPI0037CB0A65
MKIRCIIIDDEPSSQNVLKSFINKIDYLDLKQVCNDALEALEYLKNTSIDLLFLDINMPQLSGISFYKSLQKPPKVIFTTAYSEYALDGFDLDATDYLLKPFSFERFVQAISKIKVLNDQKTESIIIKSNKRLHQIKVDDILYVESLGDYIKVHFTSHFLIVYKTLKNMYTELPKTLFKQVHKSYIINKNKIDYIEGNRIIIQSNKIPLGHKYKKDFLDNFKS